MISDEGEIKIWMNEKFKSKAQNKKVYDIIART